MIGQEVEIQLQPGDRTMVNRQPSLSKSSMQGFEIKFGKHQTAKSHLSTTTPFNLDFDGDEINIWIPQDLMVEAEIEYILNTKNCIISTSTGRPSMGLVMNSVTAAHLLTLPDVTVSETTYNDMIESLTNKEALPTLNERLSKYGYQLYNESSGEKLFSGRAAVSALFPPNFYYNHKGVIIYEGILIEGVLNKSHVGPSSRSIVQELVKHYSIYRASDFLTDAPHLLNIYIVNRGFTVGINDCLNMVVDTKNEMYNTKYNKKLQIFQPIYDQLTNIIYSNKSFNEIVIIINKVNKLIDELLETSVDLSFNKALQKAHHALNNIIHESTGQCKQQLSEIFKEFFQKKKDLKAKLGEYLNEFETLEFLNPITESLNIKLKKIINSIELGYILSGEQKTISVEKLNNLPLAKDIDSINQVLSNIFTTLSKRF